MRVSEIYASTQGEGLNVGRTTVFTRFGGCNLRCPGWPCDSIHAIDPAYRNEWLKQTPQDVAASIIKTAEVSGATCVTLTGGEPFLQQNDELEELTSLLFMSGYTIDCFSNGTISYPNWAIERIQFIMDWKLTGSGETQFGPRNQERMLNLKKLANSPWQQSVKFVLKDANDFEEARSLWSLYIRDPALPIRTYYGRVWETPHLTDSDMVAMVMTNRLPWYLNMQVHNYVWDPQERGR